MHPMTEPRFLHDAASKRYRLLLADDEVAFIEYDLVGDKSVLIKHTEVLQAHEGKGFASSLVRSALNDVRGQNKTVIPICPYTLDWIRRHPEYRDVVREDARGML
jgi:predicted GNAT family acetyltransferase